MSNFYSIEKLEDFTHDFMKVFMTLYYYGFYKGMFRKAACNIVIHLFIL